jgi:hypothetical protein
MPLINNKLFSDTQIREIANATYTVASMAVSNAEVVIAANIERIYWTGGVWTIARGANTILTLPGPYGVLDLKSAGISLSEFNAANVVITTTATTPGVLILDIDKLQN